MELLTYVLFALALNLDSFGAGLAYGARQIKIPLLSLVIISLISVAAICVSMLGGQFLLSYIPESMAHKLGGIMLLLIGLWVLFQTRRKAENEADDKEQASTVTKMLEIHIRPLGLAIQVLREPARADLDSSGVITPGEALLLGSALALDAFMAGFAVSMLGFSIGITALVVGLGHFLLTYLGIIAGRTITTSKVGRQLSALPGCILILMGIYKIY